MERDHATFVGRVRELAFFERVLVGDSPHQVAHVTGPGGIGKSSLLREVARRGQAQGWRLVWIEGRDISPFPEEIDAALADLDGSRRSLIIFDSYELISSLDSHLRELVMPRLPAETVVVLAGRRKPSAGWFTGGWEHVVHSMSLDGLAPGELAELARRHGAPDDKVADLARSSRGSPLVVVLGAPTGAVGSIAELADRLVGSELERDRSEVLSVAAIARATNESLLAAVLDGRDAADDYKWLADRSFCEPLADGVAMHALVAQTVRASLRERDAAGEARLRRRIADDVYRRAIAGQSALSTDLQHLVADQSVRWGFSMDVGSRFHVDALRAGDLEQIGAVFAAIAQEEWWAETLRFVQAHPELTAVARSRDGSVGGYSVVVTPASAPPMAREDILLGPWLAHAETELRTSSAVLWREAVDLTGEGEVTSLLGAGGIIGAGVHNPRYGYLPIAPELPEARSFAESLGAMHVPALDVDAYGMVLECHIVDFGPGGVLGFQRDWIYRETGARPPGDGDAVAASRLVRALRDPSQLAHGPDWLGARPSVRLTSLRALVTEALSTFGDSRDDQLARAIVEAAFLGDRPPHEALARRFHLSRSAYFRRLHAATDRVAAELDARRPRL